MVLIATENDVVRLKEISWEYRLVTYLPTGDILRASASILGILIPV